METKNLKDNPSIMDNPIDADRAMEQFWNDKKELEEKYGTEKIKISILKDDVEVKGTTVDRALYESMKYLHGVNILDEYISNFE